MLAGQAGMKVVLAGMKRYAPKGCWPAGAGREVVMTGKCSARKNQAGKELVG